MLTYAVQTTQWALIDAKETTMHVRLNCISLQLAASNTYGLCRFMKQYICTTNVSGCQSQLSGRNLPSRAIMLA